MLLGLGFGGLFVLGTFLVLVLQGELFLLDFVVVVI
jgi:hypothetical protein